MKKLISMLLACLILILTMPVAFGASIAGDVNGDGELSIVDARTVLRYAAKLDTPSKAQLKTADIDGDGVVTVSDAREVMYMAVGIEVYIDSLVEAGFPLSYADYLAELHEKYPLWEFVPMVTGMDWATAIKNERNPHKNQLIENTVQASFMCTCSTCKGVIFERPCWVSASEEAVKYYMDPRNFLDEQYIFQFESILYDEKCTVEGVESILKDTWMHDSNITYLDAFGEQKTFKKDGKTVKYSTAIMTAAKDSGLSAYYIASKIKQEVGSSSSSTAGGSSGKNAPYNGIYNYYNLRAYTGAGDGLKWANGNITAQKDTKLYKSASTTSSAVVSVLKDAPLYYISKSGDFYRVRASVGGTNYTGYVHKSDVTVYTSYGRPWTNPYQSIYYGAKCIFDDFAKYQYTGYLQKFNINPDSPYVHSNEYMANVRAAAKEGYSSYKAYETLGELGDRKVFCIPVFKNMPNADLTREDAFKSTVIKVKKITNTADSFTMGWDSVSGAESYVVYKYNESTGKYATYKTLTDTSLVVTGVTSKDILKYKVRAYYTNSKGAKVYTQYSDVFEAMGAPAKPTGLKVASVTDTSVKLSWTAVDGLKYAVYRYNSSSKAYDLIGRTSSSAYTDKNLYSGTSYKYRIKAYAATSSANYYSVASSTVTATTTGECVVKYGYVNVSDYLNIRNKPNTTDSEVITTLTNGFKVTITGSTGDWYAVEFTLNGVAYSGYASKDYIKLEEDAPVLESCPYKEPDVTVRQGDSGEYVKWVQWYLVKLGYLSSLSDVDGSFGPGTNTAVVAFQKANNLDADGLVGPASREAMKQAYSVSSVSEEAVVEE